MGVDSTQMNGYRDIRVIKQNLRKKYRNIRESMLPAHKQKFDSLIFENLINFQKYQRAKTLLCFVSTDIEVDTKNLINHALENGKQVAVPKCLDKNGSMAFFLIKSLDELKVDSYGILEPDENTAVMLQNFHDSICILPGFAFDMNGIRIGYGKGFYDRFLQRYTGVKVGVCYNSCMSSTLPRGRFDISADYIATQKYILTVRN